MIIQADTQYGRYEYDHQADNQYVGNGYDQADTVANMVDMDIIIRLIISMVEIDVIIGLVISMMDVEVIR